MTFRSDSLASLDDLALLHITGDDAITFLQSQLTNTVDELRADEAVLAGFCQAKGRLQATLIVWPDPQDITARYMLVHASIAETLRKRLSLFLLRAKAKITLCDARVYGLTPAPTTPFTLPQVRFPVQLHNGYTLIGAPNAATEQPARAWLVDYSAASSLSATASPAAWAAADLYAGLAWVDESNYESFLPQDINLDIVGGVSFKKGCFPGQEVVARLHYRTTARRRAALVWTSQPKALALTSGQDVFTTAAPDRPLGRIVNHAYDAAQARHVALIEVLIENIDEQALYVVVNDEPIALELGTLPYRWEIAKY